jgi:SPP1 gp7 family putative phage head morphogenesis protein
MAKFNLARLKRAKGNRRRVIKFRPIKPSLRERRQLAAIATSVVDFTFGFTDELMQAYGDPAIVRDAAPDDIDRIIKMIITQTNAIMARVQIRVRGWAEDAEKRHRGDWADAVLIATGVNIETILDPHDVRETVAAVINRSTALIRDVSDEARKRIGDIVYGGVTKRTPPAELSKAIREVEPMSRRRAINIAADQAQKLNAALDRARQEEAGIPGFTWRHSGKVHAREEHLARDGEYFPWDDPPEDLPGELPFCGCSAQATLIDSETGAESEGEDFELDLEDA